MYRTMACSDFRWGIICSGPERSRIEYYWTQSSTGVYILCVLLILTLFNVLKSMGKSATVADVECRSKFCFRLPSIIDWIYWDRNHHIPIAGPSDVACFVVLSCWGLFALHVYSMWQSWNGSPEGLLQLPIHVTLALLVSLAYVLVAAS